MILVVNLPTTNHRKQTASSTTSPPGIRTKEVLCASGQGFGFRLGKFWTDPKNKFLELHNNVRLEYVLWMVI